MCPIFKRDVAHRRVDEIEDRHDIFPHKKNVCAWRMTQDPMIEF